MFWKKRESKPTSGLGSHEAGGEQEDSRTPWEKLTQPGVAVNAATWFNEFQVIDLDANGSMEMKKVHADYTSLKSVAQSYNPQVFPEMELNLDELHPIEIHESDLGKNILAALDALDIKYFNTSLSELPELATGVSMRWEDTPEGNLNLQFVRIYVDANGKELAFWYTHLLASNRPIDYRYIAQSKGGNPFAYESEERFSSPEGQYNLKWALPSILKNIAFMAETSFPSTAGMLTFTRDLAFEGIPAKARPRPAFAIVSDEMYPFTHEPEWNAEPLKPSQTVFFGWVLTEESLLLPEKVMTLVSSGCSYALEVIEDGETNHSGLFTGVDWNTYLRQPVVLASTKPEAYGQRYPAEWITLPEYSRRSAYVKMNYNDVYNLPHSQERRDGFEDLLQNGCDQYVLHAANSLVFGEYLDSVIYSDEDLEIALEILAMAFSLDPSNYFEDCQATNALCNAGILYYQAAKLDLAEKHLHEVIDFGCGSDSGYGNDDEANFVLSLLYEELGNEEAAQKHRDLGQDYNNRSKLRRPSSIDSATTSTMHEGKFCTSCGKVFLRAQQKFCPGCGKER